MQSVAWMKLEVVKQSEYVKFKGHHDVPDGSQYRVPILRPALLPTSHHALAIGINHVRSVWKHDEIHEACFELRGSGIGLTFP